jgi:hypothetical protein
MLHMIQCARTIARDLKQHCRRGEFALHFQHHEVDANAPSMLLRNATRLILIAWERSIN